MMNRKDELEEENRYPDFFRLRSSLLDVPPLGRRVSQGKEFCFGRTVTSDVVWCGVYLLSGGRD